MTHFVTNINRKQYGGRKGVGTQNCVAELMTDLTCAADTADYTSLLVTFDFSGAFNCLKDCLRENKTLVWFWNF